MVGITQAEFFSVNRIRSRFADDLGNIRDGIGTGFWLKRRVGGLCFVTNRHNVDPSIKFPDQPTLKAEVVELELRQIPQGDGKQQFSPETAFFKLGSSATKILVSGNSDCAIVVPEFEQPQEGYSAWTTFEEADLADEEFFRHKLMPAQEAYFIGFAGRSGNGLTSGAWHDVVWNLPVARVATVASHPAMEFSNPGVKTSNVLLMAGLSFSGSSGSPVISRSVGVRVSAPLKCEGFIPEKLVGIMSGHWWAEANFPEIFKHSGLSYLTRSTAILDLLKQISA